MNRIVSSKISSLQSGWHADGNNLYLRVSGNSRRWYIRFTHEGCRYYKPIGRYPMMTLKDAREKAIVFVAGKDNYQPEERTRIKIKCYKDVVNEAMTSFKRTRVWSPNTEKRWNSVLVKHTLPLWENKNITSINTNDVYKLLSSLWDTKPTTGHALQTMLENVFRFAKQMQYYNKKNPAEWEGNLDQLLPPTKKVHTEKHREAAKIDDLPEILAKVVDVLGVKNKTLAILFGTLTATRTIEFMPIREEEIDRTTMVWAVPPERRKDKKKEPFYIPLTKEALTIIDFAKHGNGYVFLGTKGTPLQTSAAIRVFKQLEIPITMHGMRSTFFDWGVEHGYDTFLLDKALCHSTGNAVRQAYQRSDCLEQRRPIMQAWADHCLSKVKALPNFQGLFD